MSNSERPIEICPSCNQPRGAHASDCPVLAEHLKAVKKEYAVLQNQKADHDKREGIPPPGTTFEEQMKDVDKNLREQQIKAYEDAERITEKFKADVLSGKISFESQKKEITEYLTAIFKTPEVTKPTPVQETRPEKRTSSLDDDIEAIRAKAYECWQKFENLAPSNEKEEIYYEIINVAKRLERIDLYYVDEEDVRDHLKKCHRSLDEINEKIKRLLNRMSK